MERLFLLTLPRRMRIAHSGTGFRDVVSVCATEPADALRLYHQQFPDGPEPSHVEEV